MPDLLLADDHTVIRSGLKALINRFLSHSTIDEAADGDSAFEKIKQGHYDLVLLDMNMPNTDPVALVSSILALKPRMKIIIFSMYDETIYAAKFLEIGVMGYLQKDESPEEIERAVTLVLNNKKYVSPRLGQLLIPDSNSRKTENPFKRLSAREFEVVLHLVRGESVAEISKELKIHTSTVGTHKARIFEKLGCSNVIELNTMAKAHNIISPD